MIFTKEFWNKYLVPFFAGFGIGALAIMLVLIISAFTAQGAEKIKPEPIDSDLFNVVHIKQDAIDNKVTRVRPGFYQDEEKLVHIIHLQSKDGRYNSYFLLVNFIKNRNPKMPFTNEKGIQVLPKAYHPCYHKVIKGITDCYYYEIKMTPLPKPEKKGYIPYKIPPKKVNLSVFDYKIAAVTSYDYLDKAIDLPATVYGLGEYMCGDVGKPRKCAKGAITASGELLYPNIVRSAAVPMPFNMRIKPVRIQIRVNGGKCVWVRINDKANPKWIGRRGLDLTPATIKASTGKYPTRTWGGRVSLCGDRINE